MYALKSHVGCCHERHGPVFRALSSVPAAAAVGADIHFASARHTGSFSLSSFLVQTPVGTAYMTLVEITNHLFPNGEKRGLNR